MLFVCLFCGMAYMTPGLSSCWDHTQNEMKMDIIMVLISRLYSRMPDKFR